MKLSNKNDLTTSGNVGKLIRDRRTATCQVVRFVQFGRVYQSCATHMNKDDKSL